MGTLRAKHVRDNTALDRILKAFLSNKLDNLSAEDQFILERISEVDARIRSGYIVIPSRWDENLGLDVEDHTRKYNRPYRKKELADWQMARFGVSMAQAYIDIDMAERFFLTTETKSDKEFARGLQIHWGEDAMAKCIADGDYRAAAAFFKELNKIKGLEKFEDEGPELKDFRPIEQIIVADPSELGFERVDNPDLLVAELRKSLKKSTIIDKIVEEAEAIEFEDLEVGDE